MSFPYMFATSDPMRHFVNPQVVADTVLRDRDMMLEVMHAFERANAAARGSADDVRTHREAESTVSMRAMLQDKYRNPPTHNGRLDIDWSLMSDFLLARGSLLALNGLERGIIAFVSRYPSLDLGRRDNMLPSGLYLGKHFFHKAWESFFAHCQRALRIADRREEALGQDCLNMFFEVAMGALHCSYENVCNGIDMAGGWYDRTGDANPTDIENFIQRDVLVSDATLLNRDLNWIYERLVTNDRTAAVDILHRINTSPSFADRGAVWSVNWPDKATFNHSTWTMGVGMLHDCRRQVQALVHHSQLGYCGAIPESFVREAWDLVSIMALNKAAAPLLFLHYAWLYQHDLSAELAWTLTRGCTTAMRRTLVLAVEQWSST